MTASTAHTATVPVGVVVIREDSDHPWQDHSWRPYGVIIGAPECTAWKELRRGEGWIQYYAATLALELHRKETEAYRENLATEQPAISGSGFSDPMWTETPSEPRQRFRMPTRRPFSSNAARRPARRSRSNGAVG